MNRTLESYERSEWLGLTVLVVLRTSENADGESGSLGEALFIVPVSLGSLVVPVQ